ncbi:hypothetical protein GTQ34_13760 [Muricauda sp. JGD-17]|uniref:Uncharacterized protein n=1 Tax=Flagellimonas ochracea TaxID=2696472 RepID=A0A964TDN2_9FLAO|nr:hypothetical protein [Allomuricauda ochracea]NAY92985.1 hypothetical protein [Allomuricauda ochracea]
MKNPYHVALYFLLLTVSFNCSKKDTAFLITEQSVGPLLKTTQVSQLESVFVRDSIVQDTSTIKVGKTTKIKIFTKSGKHLLTLTPSLDSIPTIENVRVFDARYQTDKGIGLRSTFREIQKNYSIKKIVTTLNSVVIFPRESNLYFTIDKEELPTNLRYTTSNIEAVQIPGTAKIKYLMIGWD